MCFVNIMASSAERDMWTDFFMDLLKLLYFASVVHVLGS